MPIRHYPGKEMRDTIKLRLRNRKESLKIRGTNRTRSQIDENEKRLYYVDFNESAICAEKKNSEKGVRIVPNSENNVSSWIMWWKSPKKRIGRNVNTLFS